MNPSQTAFLDSQYQTYMATIPGGKAKDDGIQTGEAAATALLALRANDGFNNVVDYECSSTPPPPGEFEPNGGCGTQPVDANVGQITPFTLVDPSCFRPGGPNPLTSKGYAKDFIETRDFGRADSTVRTAEQTDIAYFWSEHAYVYWNRNLIGLAISSGMNVRQTARFFALVHTSAADALIAGFNAKYFFRAGRPRTAIPRADTDGNPNTDPDPSWTPLLTVNHPEYPSAHGFFSSALTEGVARYFRTTKLTWTLSASKDAVPQLIKTERTYHDLKEITRQIDTREFGLDCTGGTRCAMVTRLAVKSPTEYLGIISGQSTGMPGIDNSRIAYRSSARPKPGASSDYISWLSLSVQPDTTEQIYKAGVSADRIKEGVYFQE